MTPHPYLRLIFISLGIGSFLGYLVAFSQTESGISGLYGRAVVLTLFSLAVIVAVLIGIGNLFRRERRGRPAAIAAFAVAGLLLAGAGTGYAAVPVFDFGYREPVGEYEPAPVHVVSGAMTLTLKDPGWAIADVDGRLSCALRADGSIQVSADRAGRLQGKPISASFDLNAGATQGGTVDLLLVVNTGAPSAYRLAPAAATTGNGFITWVGPAMIAEVSPYGFDGLVAFAEVPVTGEPPAGWPQALSGEARWTCG